MSKSEQVKRRLNRIEKLTQSLSQISTFADLRDSKGRLKLSISEWGEIFIQRDRIIRQLKDLIQNIRKP